MKTENLAILGARGQIGREIRALAASRGLTHRALAHGDCDITDPEAVDRAIAGCDVVVNCAGHTRVDQAESDPRAAFHVNTTGAGTVASVCARAGAVLVQISTDYVFDGSLKRPLREDDATSPLNVYGQSKLAGDEAVRTQVSTHVILRTSWVFAPHSVNFVRMIMRLADEGRKIRVVADQVGGPTAATDIAAAVLHIAGRVRNPAFSNFGTYHYCGKPAVSWYELARAIVAERPHIGITPVATREFPTAASRPHYTYLDCGRIREVLGIPQPDWLPALRRVVAEIGHV